MTRRRDKKNVLSSVHFRPPDLVTKQGIIISSHAQLFLSIRFKIKPAEAPNFLGRKIEVAQKLSSEEMHKLGQRYLNDGSEYWLTANMLLIIKEGRSGDKILVTVHKIEEIFLENLAASN